jgi:hypothetical protein
MLVVVIMAPVSDYVLIFHVKMGGAALVADI